LGDPKNLFCFPASVEKDVSLHFSRTKTIKENNN